MKLKRHNSEGIFPLLALYERGTLTKEDFCKETNLKACSFNYWMKKYRQSGKSQDRSGFAEDAESSFVKIGTGQEVLDTYRMEILLRNGCRVRFASLVPIEYVEAILSMQ